MSWSNLYGVLLVVHTNEYKPNPTLSSAALNSAAVEAVQAFQGGVACTGCFAL